MGLQQLHRLCYADGEGPRMGTSGKFGLNNIYLINHFYMVQYHTSEAYFDHFLTWKFEDMG